MVRHSGEAARHRLSGGSIQDSATLRLALPAATSRLGGIEGAAHGARCGRRPVARHRCEMGATSVDPGRVLFVNENLGGHASMHLSLREALAEVHPGLDAEFVDVPSAGTLRRGARRPAAGARSARPRPSPAALPARAERGRAGGCCAARSRRPAPPDVLHVYTQSIALRSVDLLRSLPSVVSTDATFLQGAYHLPHRRPTRFTVVGGAGRPASSSAGCTPRRRSLVAQSEWVADSLRARLRRSRADRIRVDPVRADARPRAGPPRAGRAARGHLRRRDARPQGRVRGCCGSSASTCAAAAS